MEGQLVTSEQSVEKAAQGFESTPIDTGGGALVSIEQSRAIAEVQGAIVVARSNPRDEQGAYLKIMNACKRFGLASQAEYRYVRGGNTIDGPSIRLAEAMIRYWGNCIYGFREVGRTKDSSEVEAFCHDLETNTRVVRQVRVRHWRDTKRGGNELSSERDKYEMVASMAQRRVRACILEILPGDIVEDAVKACRSTLSKEIVDVAGKAGEILEHFAKYDVHKEDIEGYLGRKMESMVPVDIINLQRIFTSLRDGVAGKEEFFKDKYKERKLAEDIDGAVPENPTYLPEDEPDPPENMRTKHPLDPTPSPSPEPHEDLTSDAGPEDYGRKEIPGQQQMFGPTDSPDAANLTQKQLKSYYVAECNRVIGQATSDIGRLDGLLLLQDEFSQDNRVSDHQRKETGGYIKSLITDYQRG